MSSVLGYELPWLEQRNGVHTAQEISHQPQLWRALSTILEEQYEAIRDFLTPLLEQPDLRIILTGAGTSAFVGDAAAPFIQEGLRFQVESIPTTDLVSNPEQYLDPSRPTLVVSYARSGNSPESVAAVALVDQLVPHCHHLFLTCNRDGELSHYARTAQNACCVIMPEGSNDKSFAMTSSFSCMLMSTLTLFGGQSPKQWHEQIEVVAALCEAKLEQWESAIKALASQPYERLIVIGSGGFAGLAREASLKSLELSAGKVMTAFDSSLGFRHGPKFTINDKAVVIQLLSSDAYTRGYDLDLFNEIRRDKQALAHIALTELSLNEDDVFEFGKLDLGDQWLCFPFILFCQMLAFEKSLQLGFGPDNPCPTGEVNRVVQGVTIYPFNK
ncbi:putative galactosamine-6-phosphate deaminase/isomerase [Vibrio harveyi]|uniref:SIS domain-containing protein n=1 Tax=Vibrio harveyi TaxID=669 RepID=UPI00066B8160|nr:SIS domain-containing protein [Vibrio harveyi]MCG9232694.1 SIS domain-containing protein [Vibrio harveyi]MCG9588468.1 SIS domain-containing protein [Vibrio harveyi]CAH1228835.1 putative galactosamine-6-phosphate deaminase/isomerase [Vibrio harveyi]CAH1576763.1 putative galactosamine-6-phosphate deaminase/isomerase [Vibrio harveyi]CAH1585822.1 putative galactosamine-6-phosphate deaminase/isomerase [Vibrio harveyi]